MHDYIIPDDAGCGKAFIRRHQHPLPGELRAVGEGVSLCAAGRWQGVHWCYNTPMQSGDTSPARIGRLKEVAAVFLKLGITGFGGLAAHIAMMHDETVRRRKWLSEQEFLDLVGATNLIPGPNSTELAIHLGFVRAGFAGLLVAGVSFILPAVLIVTALAWGYARYGAAPQTGWLLYGIKPVVIAIILQALWTFGKKALRGVLLTAVALGAAVLYLTGIHEIALLFGGGALMLLITALPRLRKANPALVFLPPLAALNLLPGTVLSAAAPFSLWRLFFTFLKIGSLLYGSGYVLLAFLHGDFVTRFGWLTERQLLDAVAVGQMTPGPLFTTATFIGYLLGGMPGALLATLAFFLPAFVLVAVSSPFVRRLRCSPLLAALLDGVNAAALGLMAVVTWSIGRDSITDLPTVLIALVSLLLLVRFKVNATWLIAAGALIGVVFALLH